MTDQPPDDSAWDPVAEHQAERSSSPVARLVPFDPYHVDNAPPFLPATPIAPSPMPVPAPAPVPAAAPVPPPAPVAPAATMTDGGWGGGVAGPLTTTAAPPPPMPAPPMPPPPMPAPPMPAPPMPALIEERSRLRSVIEWLVVGGTALVLALVIRAFLFQTFFIPSPSMTPTLRVHDRILVNKLAYDVHSVHRGDIVVFKRNSLHGIPNDEIKNLVKRVVGLPGDTIQTTPDGRVEINGAVLKESYLPRGTLTVPGIAPTVIPPHHYFVMGDNRTNSSDSRVFGPIDRDLIVGRAFVLIWPLRDLSLL